MTSPDDSNAPRWRLEDPPLLRGTAAFVDDLPIDAAEAAFVRSPIAAGAITSVDAAPAMALDGVIAVFTAVDLSLGRLRGHDALPPVFDRPPLADGRVNFVGEPVAVVIAATRAIATDAAGAVDVSYVSSDPVIDPGEALSDRLVRFVDHGTNVAFERALPDDDGVLDGSAVVVRLTCRNQRLAAAPMEPDGVLAVPGDGADELTVWASTQRVHKVRDAIAGGARRRSGGSARSSSTRGRGLRRQVRAVAGGDRRGRRGASAAAPGALGADRVPRTCRRCLTAGPSSSMVRSGSPPMAASMRCGWTL